MHVYLWYLGLIDILGVFSNEEKLSILRIIKKTALGRGEVKGYLYVVYFTWLRRKGKNWAFLFLKNYGGLLIHQINNMIV